MHFGGVSAYSIAFAIARHSLKEPPQPGIIVSLAGMSLATAVPGTRVTSAGEIPGGNSSPAINFVSNAVNLRTSSVHFLRRISRKFAVF